MDLAFSEEQDQLRAVAREFLADAYPIDDVSRIADSAAGWDPAGWKAIAELGWLDAELGPLEHAVLLEEAAAALLPAPLFSSLALALPGIDEEETLRADVAVGRRRLTFAWMEDGRSQDLRAAGQASTATLNGRGRISGCKVLVPDAAIVDGFLVTARTPDDEIALCLVDVGDGVSVRSVPTIDSTRRLGTVQFDASPAQQLVAGSEATSRLDRMAQHALVGAACEAAGVAQRALDIAVGHARVREQFGRPIGSYQAISHRIADVYVQLQLARSLATWAAWNLAESSVDPQVMDAAMATAAAKSYATEAAVAACESAIQVLGGIGFTWDHPLHRYYKRAQWLDAFGGNGPRQRAIIAAALLD